MLALEAEKPVRGAVKPDLCERCKDAQDTATGAQFIQQCRIAKANQPEDCPKQGTLYTMPLTELTRSLVTGYQAEVETLVPTSPD